MNCNLEHYLNRSTEWFNFLIEHPLYMKKHIIRKLFNKQMLTAIHAYMLFNNAN